jgi:hypothetical protein
VEKGAILLQPCGIHADLQARMGIKRGAAGVHEWLVGLRAVPESWVFHEMMFAQREQEGARIAALESANKKKLVGAAQHVAFLMGQSYLTTAPDAKEGLTTTEMNQLATQYQTLEENIATCSRGKVQELRQQQLVLYTEQLWPIIRRDFMMDPSGERLVKNAKAKSGATVAPRLPHDSYTGLVCILPRYSA